MTEQNSTSERRYAVREIFSTLQGEGAQAGSPAVFLRFAGCNLGYAVCPWCDTDWVKATLTGTAAEVVTQVRAAATEAFGGVPEGLLLVATGGEPSLQLDRPLAGALRGAGFRITMETNGSREIDRATTDWLTVSPKQREYAQREGDELKLVYTGASAPGITPDVEAVRSIARDTRFEHYFLQPVDLPDDGGPNYAETLRALHELGPPWRLSVQTHKVIGIP